MVDGIVLYSGGLDSLLAAKVLLNQNLNIIGFHCILPFTAPDIDPMTLPSSKLADQIGLPLHFYRCENEYINMVKNPAHGYGKNMNPCIDCKIHFINKAFEYMHEIGASFIATGEVVGQRPMSQKKHMLKHIINETDNDKRLLRPLSAKLLDETLPEQQGIVNRELLYDISGRSRKQQMQMAKEFNIESYASPGGGCLFTDPSIAKRVKDLIDHHDKIDATDFYLLTIGRHFRINDSLKIIIARNAEENDELFKYKNTAQLFLEPEFKGPMAYVKGLYDAEDKETIATIIARYGKPQENDNQIIIFLDQEKEVINVSEKIEDSKLELMRI